MKMSDAKLGKVFCVCRVIYIDTLVWGTKFCPVATPVARPPPMLMPHPDSVARATSVWLAENLSMANLASKWITTSLLQGFLFIASNGESTALAGHQEWEWGNGETGREEADKINVCKVCNEPKKERRRTRSMSEFNCPVVWLIEKSQVFRRRK